MENMRHRYAAILAADVAHYSTLMEGDGEGTVRALKECRAVFQRCVTEHGGREFGSVGDSLMAEFPSPVGALRAARCIQSDIERNALAQSADMRFRIGLHAGDVISESEDLFGDVVNCASRIGELAQPGSIAMSAFFHEQVRKEPGVRFRSLGRHQLKNIADPIKVFEVERRHRRVNWRRLGLKLRPYKGAIAGTLGGLAVVALVLTLRDDRAGIVDTPIVVPEPNSIAVLPFRSLDGDESAVLLADSFHADVIAQLSKLPQLGKVPSSIVVERYRDTERQLGEVGRELDVAYVVEGDLRSTAEVLRINVRMVDAIGDSPVWANTYDREVSAENLLSVQGEIARDIAIELQVTLTAEQESAILRPATQSILAYNAYRSGEAEMLKMTPAGLLSAQAHFQRAIEEDPDYVLAYVGLADSLGLRIGSGDGTSVEDVIEPWQEAISKALALDPLSGEAHTSLAYLRTMQERYEDAEKLLARAIELSPDYYAAHHLQALFLSAYGKEEEALIELRKAHELNPNSPQLVKDLVATLQTLGRDEEAETRLLEAIRKNPEFMPFYPQLYFNWRNSGRTADSLHALDAWLVVEPDNFTVIEWRCFALIHLGDYEGAEECTAKVEKEFETDLIIHKGMLSAVRRRDDEAVAYVDQLAAQNHQKPMAYEYLGQMYVLYGQPEKAAPYVEKLSPELLVDENTDITPRNINAAFLAGVVLDERGETARADDLFDRALEVMKYMPRTVGESVGFRDILIHVYRDEPAAAISALRDGLDHGWRSGSWFLLTPMFDKMNDYPEWTELMQRLEAEMNDEVDGYWERKGTPLFELFETR